VREVVHRDLYHGVILWNRTRKRDPWGQQKQRRRPTSKWIELPSPELRIVSDAEWKSAHDRLETGRVYLRANNGQLLGRRSADSNPSIFWPDSPAAVPVEVRSPSAAGATAKNGRFSSACSSFHHRGRTVCANSLEMHLHYADGAILIALERDLLDEQVIDEAMTRAITIATSGQSGIEERRRDIRKALDLVAGELDRLTAAILAGGEAATIVQAMRERERRRTALRVESADLDTPADAGRLRQQLRAKLNGWRAMLRSHAPQARQMISQADTRSDRVHSRSGRAGLPVHRAGDAGQVFQRFSASTRCHVPNGSRSLVDTG
jgi:hypothetical protein